LFDDDNDDDGDDDCDDDCDDDNGDDNGDGNDTNIFECLLLLLPLSATLQLDFSRLPLSSSMHR